VSSLISLCLAPQSGGHIHTHPSTHADLGALHPFSVAHWYDPSFIKAFTRVSCILRLIPLSVLSCLFLSFVRPFVPFNVCQLFCSSTCSSIQILSHSCCRPLNISPFTHTFTSFPSHSSIWSFFIYYLHPSFMHAFIHSFIMASSRPSLFSHSFIH
jgi:hypothetical protein